MNRDAVCPKRFNHFVKRLMKRGFDQADAENEARDWFRLVVAAESNHNSDI